MNTLVDNILDLNNELDPILILKKGIYCGDLTYRPRPDFEWSKMGLISKCPGFKWFGIPPSKSPDFEKSAFRFQLNLSLLGLEFNKRKLPIEV